MTDPSPTPRVLPTHPLLLCHENGVLEWDGTPEPVLEAICRGLSRPETRQ